MMGRMLIGRLSAAAIVSTMFCSISLAADPLDKSISYQGRLTNSGSPVTGLADLKVRVYNAAVGGARTGGPITLLNVPVQDGLFNLNLDFGAFDFAFIGEMRWLDIEVRSPPGVGLYTKLTPRQEITSVPSALTVRLPLVQEGSTPDSLLELTNNGAGATIKAVADGGGLALHALGPVEIGANNTNGLLRLFNSGGNGLLVSDFLGNGAQLIVYDEDNDPYFAVQPDLNGVGAFLTLNRSATESGLVVDGNADGTESTRVIIDGNVSPMSFDTSISGDSSVQLPSGSVNASETGNEAGIAAQQSDGFLTLTGGVDIILARIINCPTSGYVLVIGTCQAALQHTSGTGDSVIFGVSDTIAALPSSQQVNVNTTSSMTTGNYNHAVTVHGVFEVSAGAHQFYFLADEISGQTAVDDMQLTVIFFPTAYGQVNPTAMTRQGEADAIPMLPMTAQDLEADRLRALRFDLDRTRADLAAQLEQMNRIQRELDQITSEQNPIDRVPPPNPQNSAFGSNHQ